MLPLALLANRVIALGNLGGFAIGAVMMSVTALPADLRAGGDGPRAAAAGMVLGACR